MVAKLIRVVLSIVRVEPMGVHVGCYTLKLYVSELVLVGHVFRGKNNCGFSRNGILWRSWNDEEMSGN